MINLIFASTSTYIFVYFFPSVRRYACTGAAEKKKETPPEYSYLKLVERFNLVGTDDSQDPKSVIAEQIRRDLHRTFPMNIKINTPEGMEKLRRILGA